MEKRTQALHEILKEAQGLGGTNTDARFSFVEKIIRQLLLSLTQLSKAWKVDFPLPRSIFFFFGYPTTAVFFLVL